MGTILVVDDDVLVRRMMRRLLERAGHRVSEAANGLEALEALKGGRPDLVVTDVQMPQMNGLEFMIEARKLYPDIRVAAMSGSGSSRGGAQGVLLLARDLGAAATLEKPVHMATLLRTVAELVPPPE
jgi:CheY-like chemotaxis protein